MLTNPEIAARKKRLAAALEEDLEIMQRIERTHDAQGETRVSAAPVPGLECRYSQLVVRAETKSGKKRLAGHAAVFNSLSSDLGGFFERLAPGCFARSLRERPDVALLNGHDVTKPLARTRNNSLRVWEDSEGLAFDCELGDSSICDDTYSQVREGLLDSMSFGMIVRSDGWADQMVAGARTRVRTVTDCDLLEISCVLWPAYESSSVGARALLWPSGQPAELRSYLSAGAAISETEMQERRIARQKAARFLE